MSFPMLVMVGAAGFVGTLLRYVSAVVIASHFERQGPATLFVNVVGSFAIGWVLGSGTERFSPQVITVLTVGLLGGFTTYSAFSADAVQFLREGRWLAALGYVAAMLALGLLATFAGFWMASKSA